MTDELQDIIARAVACFVTAVLVLLGALRYHSEFYWVVFAVLITFAITYLIMWLYGKQGSQ